MLRSEVLREEQQRIYGQIQSAMSCGDPEEKASMLLFVQARIKSLYADMQTIAKLTKPLVDAVSLRAENEKLAAKLAVAEAALARFQVAAASGGFDSGDDIMEGIDMSSPENMSMLDGHAAPAANDGGGEEDGEGAGASPTPTPAAPAPAPAPAAAPAPVVAGEDGDAALEGSTGGAVRAREDVATSPNRKARVGQGGSMEQSDPQSDPTAQQLAFDAE